MEGELDIPKRIETEIDIKVRQFQNEFMKSSFLPKYEQKVGRISVVSAEILTICCSYLTMTS